MDTKKIKQIIELFEESKIYSMDLEIDDIKIKLEKQGNAPQQVVMPQSVVSTPVVQENAPASDPVVESKKDWVKSPLVGTYYASTSQGGKALVSVGDQVNKGDVVCIIEAMKVMNEIKAHCSGVVSEIKVQDGDMVQFDQEMIAIGE